MKYKYLAISGDEIEMETERTKDDVIAGLEEDGEVISVTPIVEIDGIPYWNPKTQFGEISKEEWKESICPQLQKIYECP